MEKITGEMALTLDTETIAALTCHHWRIQKQNDGKTSQWNLVLL